MGGEQHGIYPRGFSTEQKWSWPLVPSHKLVKLNYGKALRATERSEGPIPVYGTNGQCGTHNKSLIKGPGVILGRKGQGPLGVEWCDSDFWVIDTAYYVSLEVESIDLRYFYYLTKYIGLNHLKDGTSNPSLSRDTFALQLLPLPPITMQKSMVAILRSFDDKIQLNRRMNETLEGMAQALFKSWFVDFDPVLDNALFARNPIPEELTERAEVRRQALANGTTNREAAKSFPDAFQFTEELGWIPKGWEVRPLDKIANYRNGLALQKFRPNPEETPLPIVKIAQLKNGEATWDEVASPNITPECIIDDGDVVFSWSGSLMIDLWCGGKAALNQHLFKVTSTDFPKWFYLNWSNEHLYNFQRIASYKAVTMGHIKRSHLSEAYCAIPGSSLIAKASEIFMPYVEEIVHQRVENRTLSKLRDTLLPKLISGEIRIPDAEKLAEEALA